MTWRAFSSSTTNAKVAKHFLSAGGSGGAAAPEGTLFIVESRGGARDVRAYSAIPMQDEVLYPVNSQFRVVARVSGGCMRLLSQVCGGVLWLGRACSVGWRFADGGWRLTRWCTACGGQGGGLGFANVETAPAGAPAAAADRK